MKPFPRHLIIDQAEAVRAGDERFSGEPSKRKIGLLLGGVASSLLIALVGSIAASPACFGVGIGGAIHYSLDLCWVWSNERIAARRRWYAYQAGVRIGVDKARQHMLKDEIRDLVDAER